MDSYKGLTHSKYDCITLCLNQETEESAFWEDQKVFKGSVARIGTAKGL